MKSFFSYLITGLILSVTFFSFVKCNNPSSRSDNQKQAQDSVIKVVDSLSHIHLLFVGDVMGHGRQLRSANIPGTDDYDFTGNYIYVKDIISKADIAVANLEVPIAANPPYRGYPLFRSPAAKVEALKWAGFNLLLTANNHSNDAGKSAFENTIKVISENELYQTGTFLSKEARDSLYPLFIEKNDFKIAFLNYSYGTNGIPDNYPNITNLIDTAQIRIDVSKALDSMPDLIIACMHWGNEYQLNESGHQRNLAQFLADLGVDLIIGSHPHVIQPIKWIYTNEGDSIVCAFSLGNFVSNQRFPNTDGGMIFEIEYSKNIFTDEVFIKDFGHRITWVYKSDRTDSLPHGEYFIIPVREFENSLITDIIIPDKHLNNMNTFVSNMRKHLKNTSVSKEREIE